LPSNGGPCAGCKQRPRPPSQSESRRDRRWRSAARGRGFRRPPPPFREKGFGPPPERPPEDLRQEAPPPRSARTPAACAVPVPGSAESRAELPDRDLSPPRKVCSSKLLLRREPAR